MPYCLSCFTAVPTVRLQLGVEAQYSTHRVPLARGSQWVLYYQPMPMTPKQLRQARKGLALTQQALADRLGVHVQTVKKWEGGERRISEPVALLLRVWLKEK